MNMNKVLEIPYGTKDILPGEAKIKRTLEREILDTFYLWGYDEVVTPTFEYLETFQKQGPVLNEESFKFFDRNNRGLVLRNDMTAPIARMTAARLQDGKLLKRLSYMANIFRYEETQAGRQCEFTQAGVELLGTNNVAADAEVLALAIASLRASGLRDFSLSIGHSRFLEGLLEEAAVSEAEDEILRQHILNHDLVGLEESLKNISMHDDLKAIFQELLLLHGDEKLLEKISHRIKNEKSQEALANLQEIYTLLQAFGNAGCVTFDLSLIRNLNYYTGMVFEIYSSNMGFPLGGGGRYDKMMEAFGVEGPACGFALGIERLMLVLSRKHELSKSSQWDIYVGYTEDQLTKAIIKATQLRDMGKTVKMALAPCSLSEANENGKEYNCRELVFID